MRVSHKLQALYARGNAAITVYAVQGRMVIVNLAWLCAIVCFITLCHFHLLNIYSETGGRLKVNRWIGTHFHDYIDFYGVAFSAIFNRVTRMGLHIFEILGVRKLWQVRIHKQEDSWQKSCYRILIFNKRLPFHSGLAEKQTKMA